MCALHKGSSLNAAEGHYISEGTLHGRLPDGIDCPYCKYGTLSLNPSEDNMSSPIPNRTTHCFECGVDITVSQLVKFNVLPKSILGEDGDKITPLLQGEALNFENMADEEIIDIANPIINKLMEVLSDIYMTGLPDSVQFSRRINDLLKEEWDQYWDLLTEERDQCVSSKCNSRINLFAERKLLRIIKRPSVALITWKQLLTKNEGPCELEIRLIYNAGKFSIDRVLII